MPKTLLLADESVTIQRVIELTFAHEDVRVVSVSDGRRAVQWMDTEWPDIVLADVELPELDGYAVCQHVKKSPRLKGVPVLLLAGAFQPVDEARARSIGSVGVLVKPFEPQQLVSRVKTLLAGASSSRQTATGSESGRAEPATVTPFPVPSAPALRVAHAAFDDPGSVPQPLELPVRPVWETGGDKGSARPPEPLAPAAAPAAGKVSLASAFSALLAAEHAGPPQPPAQPPPAVSDDAIEEAVRRVLVRMTEDVVRGIVHETAERLVREEIERIKTESKSDE
jgi:CheY-like chemotaxis protein